MSDPSNKPIWIMGCGDIGIRLALLYQKQNRVANVLVSSKGSAKNCQAHTLNTTQCNLDVAVDDLQLQHYISTMHHALLFYFIPPPKDGVIDNRLRKFIHYIEQAKQPIKKLVLISTTGVYGDCQGQWINEEQPVNPIADRAKRRLDAEITLRQWAEKNNVNFVILRVAGIYAKDRLPLTRLKKQIPMIRKEESPWMNRIHADDLARISLKAMEKNLPHDTYNACDGSPSTMTDYFDCVARYAHLPLPPKISKKQAENCLSAGMLSYLNESKRIINQRLLNDFAIQLQWQSVDDCLS